MTQFEDVLETILEEYARRDSEGEFDTWEETDAFVKKKAEILLAYVKEEPVSEDLEEAFKKSDQELTEFEKAIYKIVWLADVTCSSPNDLMDLVKQHGKELLSIARKQGEQNHVWSEEDEIGWANTMIMIKECASNHYNKDSIKLVVDWFESIKDKFLHS